jgi:tagaturonate reductase
MQNTRTLNRELVASPEFASDREVDAPGAELLDLPEKVVQFGTGAFLRGFVDYFIDAANRAGHFDGRVVMVGSTGSGRDQALTEQDGLYTLATLGLVRGVPVSEYRVIGSVSRALSAAREWDQVLACARDPQLELVFSNTTEVGIALDPEDAPDLLPPRSFPGKLTRFLYERGRAFQFAEQAGVVVIPCELIADNGDRLREIVLQLAERWDLEPAFRAWIENAVPFCNTLVDRIVPGTPTGEQAERIRSELGYQDTLLTVCESYRLFPIQADEQVAPRLRFAKADPGIVLTDDVSPFRERKVRILNGGHTIMVSTALLAGCEIVSEAVEHPLVGAYLRRVMFDEIVPSLQVEGAEQFARDVLDRFANPFIRHALFDITLQSTMKMRVRVVPSILKFSEIHGRVPESLAFGFAAYLLFMRGDLHERRRASGASVPADDQAERVRAFWNSRSDQDDAELHDLARQACSDTDLWGVDLTTLPGFSEAVALHLTRAHNEGITAALEGLLRPGTPGVST